jgi:hypothetical protein
MSDMHHILPRFTRYQQQREDEQKVARVILESGNTVDSTTTMAARATAAGDSRRLRGIPCVARSVGGVSPGSDPVAALLRKQPRE